MPGIMTMPNVRINNTFSFPTIKKRENKIPMLRPLGPIRIFSSNSGSNYACKIINGKKQEKYDSKAKYELAGIGKNAFLVANMDIKVKPGQKIQISVDKEKYLPKSIEINGQKIEAQEPNKGIFIIPGIVNRIRSLVIFLLKTEEKFILTHPKIV
ncbi:hypothetical protein ACFL2K_00170 [Candidatus Margulisiibacteriota bacterium]